MTSDAVTFIVGCGIVGFCLVYFLVKPKYAPAKLGEKADTGEHDRRVHNGPNEGPTRQWFEVLEVDRGCSLDQLQAAYRQKIAQYHPDRVATLGVELRNLANQKSIEINAAYELGKKLKA